MSEKQTIFCTIRKEYVAALPEEIVRQRFLHHMIEERGFPSSLIAVEKSLKQLPHLSSADKRSVPDRRADILCFAKDVQGFGLYPLLLVECKAIKLSPAVINQVVGYNHFVRACFLTIVNQAEIRTGWYDKDKREYTFLDYLPSYEELRG